MAILEVEHLEKRFGGTPVLQDVSFSLEQGQTLGKAAVYQGEALLEEYEVRAATDAPRMTVRDAIGLLWQSLTGAA